MAANIVGILALQGDFQRHAESLGAAGLEIREVRTGADLVGLRGLVLPGGESTTMLRLLEIEDMFDPLREVLSSGLPVLATCCGLILIAEQVLQPPQKSMCLLPIDVIRNGYGRQFHSGTFPLESDLFPGTTGVFIRVPRIVRVGDSVEVLARWNGDPVLIQKGPILASCFHPELQDNHPLTRYFVDLIRGKHAPSSTLIEP